MGAIEGGEIVLHVTLAVDGELVAARLDSARVESAVLSLAVYGVEAKVGASRGSTRKAKAPASSPVAASDAAEAPAAKGSPGWGDVAAASAAAEEGAESGGASWADVAVASAEAKKREIVEDAELTWAQVAKASSAAEAAAPKPAKKRRRRKPEPKVPVLPKQPLPTSRDRAPKVEPDVFPEKGDYVSHKQFGLCKVEVVHDDGGLLIKLPNSRRKRIKLDPFVVEGPTTDGKGRTVFHLKKRPKR